MRSVIEIAFAECWTSNDINNSRLHMNQREDTKFLLLGSLTDKRKVIKKHQSEPTLTKEQTREKERRIAWYRLQNEIIESGPLSPDKTLFSQIPDDFMRFKPARKFQKSSKRRRTIN